MWSQFVAVMNPTEALLNTNENSTEDTSDCE